MNVILEQHQLRKLNDITLNTTVVFVSQTNENDDHNANFVYRIRDIELLFFTNIKTLKDLLKTIQGLKYSEIFFVDDRIEEFIISEEYIRVIEKIKKEYNIDASKMTRNEVIDRTNNKDIFTEIKGKLECNGKVIENISWINYDILRAFIRRK